MIQINRNRCKFSLRIEDGEKKQLFFICFLPVLLTTYLIFCIINLKNLNVCVMFPNSTVL